MRKNAFPAKGIQRRARPPVPKYRLNHSRNTMADQSLPLHGTAYYGQARFDVGLFGWLKDWTHCSNAFCMLCYPNTLTRIAWKANIVICGIKTPKLRGFLWAAFFLFAFECINFLLGSTVITVVAWFGLGLTYVWSVFVLHKTVQENQRLRPVCLRATMLL